MKYCAYLFIVLFTLCSCGDEYLRKRVCDENKQIYYGRKDESESVYICTGETSTKYHTDPDCRGLSRCSGEIEEVSEEEAEDMGRTPCKICY